MVNTRKSSPTGERPYVVLGVTGGIAAYKTPQIVRLLAERADVRVVLTRSAGRFVAPLTFEVLSGRPVLQDMFGGPDPMPHITEGERADLVVVAPATADFISRAARGRADDLLGALLLVTRAPLVVAPAMNSAMWSHPATRRSMISLERLGRVHRVGPGEGDLACGWTGPGRMADPEAIVEVSLRILGGGGLLEGRRVVVTAGPTEEPIDPVRVLSNRSSGRMGRAIAAQAAAEGARVTLVRGPVSIEDPHGVEVVPVRTTEQMLAAVKGFLGEADLLVMAAAVADWKPREPSSGKIRKKDVGDRLVLDLVPTPDILSTCVSLRKGERPLIVGFSLETDPAACVGRAREKIRRKGCDLVVANLASENLGTEEGRVVLVAPRTRATEVGPASKTDLARAILSWAAKKLD